MDDGKIEKSAVNSPAASLLDMYRAMVRIRRCEERLADMVEAKEIGTPCHLYIGQEAVAAGVCAALRVKDYVWGGHRSHGHYLAKGGELRSMIAEVLGKEAGCSRGRGGSMHLIAREVGILGTVPLVAATIPLAVGTALASKLRKDGLVSVAFFGDGATEEGHFHESVNLAAVHKLPVVFVCENNFYASHMSLLERRAADNIALSAQAHGIAGVAVDGNDIEAVFNAASQAAERARSGSGPTILECRTYRWRGHVGPDWNYDVGVRRKDELKEWLPKDPVARVRRRLIENGVAEAQLSGLEGAVELELDAAITFARESPYPSTESLGEHLFVERANS